MSIFAGQRKKNAYQQNMSSPVQPKPVQLNTRTVLGKIRELSTTDNNAAFELKNSFDYAQNDKSSALYNPFSKPTNKAFGYMQDLGIDMSGYNGDEWLAANSQMKNWFAESANTNNAKAPTKKSSWEERVGYNYNQIWDAQERTNKALLERKALGEEVDFLVNKSGKNYSDDQIVGMIDWEKKYPTLFKAQESAKAGEPIELNSALDVWNNDGVYGLIWKSRNPDADVDINTAMANSYLGVGNVWKYDPKIDAKLDPNSPDFDGGYSLGSTNIEDAATYFGVPSFTNEWIEGHQSLAFSTDETERQMYGKVLGAYDNYQKAQEELAELNRFVDAKLKYLSDPEKIMGKIDWKKYPTLAAMDKSIGQNGNLATGNLVALTDGVNYRYSDLYARVEEACANKKGSIVDFIAANTEKTLTLPDETAKNGTDSAKDKTVQHPGFRPTDEQIKIAKEEDKILSEDAEMTERVNTPSEKTANDTQLSSMYDYAKEWLGSFKSSVSSAINFFSEKAIAGNIANYSGTVLRNFDTVSSYEQNEQTIEDLENREYELRKKIGNLTEYGKEFQTEGQVKEISVDGTKVALNIQYDPSTDSFIIADRLNKSTGDSDVYSLDPEKRQAEEQKALEEINSAYRKNKEANDPTRTLTEEEEKDIAEYRKTSEDLETALARKEKGQEAYDKAQKEIEDAQLSQDMTISMMKAAGIDTKEMEYAAATTNFFLNFTKYSPTKWAEYNFYHSISQMLISGEGSTEEALKKAESGDASILEAIDVAKTMLEYADEKGMVIPDNVRENILRYIDSLDRQHQDYLYMSMIRNDDFDEGANKGLELAQGNEKFDWDAYGEGGLEALPMWNILSQEQQERLKALESDPNSAAMVPEQYEYAVRQMDLNNRLFSIYQMDDIMTDYEKKTYYYLLGTQGIGEAEKYFDHLTDSSYGVMNSRAAERTKETAENLASKGFWGRRAADAISMLMSPIAAIGSLAYGVEYGLKKLSGERVEFNPNNANLTANIYKKAAREKINEEIINAYGKGTPIQKFMSTLQEIISNRGDSLVNGLVFGPLFKGISSNIAQEFLSAIPMALGAATDAVAEAKENGVADDANLLGIFATTLLFEAGTEAITIGNIKEAFEGAKDISVDGLSNFLKNWLTDSGIEEMIGETVTEIAEQEFNKLFAGENSDYERRWRELQNEKNISEQEAKMLAGKEMMDQVLHTALVSYLSPGMDIASYGYGRYSGYKSEAKFRQQNDLGDVSVLDVYREYKQAREEAKNKPATRGEDRAEQNAPNEQNVPEAAEEAAGTAVPENEQTVSPEQKRAQDFTLDFEILESAKENDTSSQTASVASVLDEEGTQESSDRANAAAANAGKVFGDTNPADGMQTIIVGAHAAGVDSSIVKEAVRTAALSESSEAYQVMQSEEYQSANPAEKAIMLSETIEADTNNAEVQNQVNQSVRENRVARAEQKVTNAPEVKTAREKTANAYQSLLDRQQETQRCQEQYDGLNDQLDAIRENLRNADPADVNNVNACIADLKKMGERVQQAKTELDKAMQNEQKATDEDQRATEELANTKRQLAEQMINEEDSQRAEAKAQAEAEAVVQAEQEAKQQAIQESTDNANVADVEGFMDLVRKENPDLTKEDEQKIRDRFAEIQQKRSRQTPVEDERGADGKLTDRAKIARNKAVEFVNRKFGLPVVLADDITEEDSNGVYSEGFYDPENHRIVLNNDLSFDEIMTRVLPHELLHSIEQAGSYNSVVNSLLGIFYGQDSDFEQAVKNLEKNNGVPTSRLEADILHYKGKYEKGLKGKRLSYLYAAQETVAHRMGDMFYNPDNPQRSREMIDRLAAEKPNVAKQIMNSLKSMVKKALGMKGAWLTNTQKTIDLFEKALSNSASNQTRSDSKLDQFEGMRKYELGKVNDVTREDIYNLLEGVSNGQFKKSTYIPLRRNTPEILIEKVKEYTKGEVVLENRAIISNVRHMQQNMDESIAGYNPKHKPHDLSPNEMISVIEGMDNPSYIVYQKDNDRYVEVVRFYGEKRKHVTWAVIDFSGDWKSRDQMNGYEDNNYNVLVTAFDPKDLQNYMDNPDNVIIYDKSKDASSMGSGRLWPSRAEFAPFNEKLSQDDDSVKRSLPEENNTLVSNNDGEPLATELPGGTVTVDTGTKYSLASFTPDEQKKVRQALIDSGRYTVEEVDKYLDGALGIASAIAADRLRLDFDVTDPEKSMVKPNADYGASIDASTLCAKRLLYQGTFDAIQHLLPNTPLMPEDLINLANMMREMGYEVPCGICYVESRRRNLDKFADEWLQGYQGEYIPKLEEVTTSDGLEELRKSHPQAYKDFIQAMKDLNQRNPKVVQLRTEYRGEIRDMTDRAVQKAINHGGLRLQSFSDFETPHLLDMVQVVMDMASKGLTSQAYTKVPNFAWAFGDTGIKINLSLIGKGEGVDENGNLVFDDVEGMPYAEAMKLRERYSKNVGTILVGINDKHILAAMADPNIDFIIPFHRSGWTKNDLRLMPVIEKYTDYTLTQNERDIKTGKKTDKNLEPVGEEGYWDFSKSGKENAEAYLELCYKNGLIPKFDQFLDKDENGHYYLKKDGSTDGYWKTLIDFKMYDNEGNGSPQTAVTPNVNMDEAQRILDDYKLERQQPNAPAVPMADNNSLPVAQPVVERYVEEYKANHPLDETRIRYSLPSDDILDQQINDYLNRGGSLAQQSAPLGPDQGYRQWGNEGAQRSDELDQQAKDYVLNSPYTRDTNAAELDRAIEWIRGNRLFSGDDGFQESLSKVTSKHFNYRTKDGQARMVAVMALAVARGDTAAQVQLADAYNQQGTDLGQALQARKLFRLMTPQGRVASLQKMLRNVQDELERRNIDKTVTLSDWIIQAASEATDEGDFARLQKAAARELAEQIPASWKDRLRGLRMLSMLGNPRTHIRNIVGNALFVPAVSLKNKMAAVAEQIFLDEGERTKTLSLTLPKEIKDFVAQDADFNQDELTGEAKYNEGNLVQREQKPFKGFLQALMDFNSNMLEKEDWLFLKGHYKRALGGWIQANGYTVDQLKQNPSLLEQGRAYAISEAQKATYRDFNGLADRLNKMSRDPQTTGAKVLGFVTEAVLPFKKTPANILKRGLEYSPAGLVRGLKNLAFDMKSGKITPTQVIDRICSGLAGTAVLALGAFLGKAGIVKCGLGDDDDKNEKEQGNQKYSIRLKLFGEDVTYTMDWAAPMSMPFFVGAALADQLDKTGEIDINSLMDAMGNITEPVLNLSMLDGVNTLFKTSQYDDTDTMTQIGAKVLSNYASSYVPSVLGAITRTLFDDRRRATFVKSGEGKGVTGTFKYAWEQVENKTPGLSRTNIPVRDVFGNEEMDSFVERIFENFISPGYISHYKNNPVLNEMDRLYAVNVTDSEDMVPKDPPKTIKYNGENRALTAEEWDRYKTERGRTAYTMLTELINSTDYKQAGDEAQIQMIKKVWDYAGEVGKKAAIPDYEINDSKNGNVESFTREGKIANYNSKMMQCLADGDYEGYETMVEGLREEGVEDSTIKQKIAGKYRDLYKEAYRKQNYDRMAEIEEILYMTDFDFDLDSWEDQVDRKYGF